MIGQLPPPRAREKNLTASPVWSRVSIDRACDRAITIAIAIVVFHRISSIDVAFDARRSIDVAAAAAAMAPQINAQDG